VHRDAVKETVSLKARPRKTRCLPPARPACRKGAARGLAKR
jgi:hypothetical protein